MTPISVLVVDDSVVVRKLVTDALGADPEIRVAGTAANGQIALSKLEQLAPDVVTLDIEMPVLDGLATLRQLRATHPGLPVIMFSTLTEKGAAATLEALSLGASDYVTKPANVGSVTESIARVREDLIPRIRALTGRPLRPAGVTAPADAPGPRRPADSATGPARPARTAPAMPLPGALGRIDVLAIGCSTGGPEALVQVLPGLPRDLPVPVVLVQHMPKIFTRLLAERLDRLCSLAVVEAADGQPVVPGTIAIAPGDYHLEVVASGAGVVTRLQQGPPENFCRPAVDVLFRSVAKVYGGRTLAAILTGMGADGRRGCEVLKAAGGHVVAQDEASSVVWGMPGAVTNAGLADAVLPLAQVAGYLAGAVRGGRLAGTSGGRR